MGDMIPKYLIYLTDDHCLLMKFYRRLIGIYLYLCVLHMTELLDTPYD